jgi:hypothetical protein
MWRLEGHCTFTPLWKDIFGMRNFKVHYLVLRLNYTGKAITRSPSKPISWYMSSESGNALTNFFCMSWTPRRWNSILWGSWDPGKTQIWNSPEKKKHKFHLHLKSWHMQNVYISIVCTWTLDFTFQREKFMWNVGLFPIFFCFCNTTKQLCSSLLRRFSLT